MVPCDMCIHCLPVGIHVRHARIRLMFSTVCQQYTRYRVIITHDFQTASGKMEGTYHVPVYFSNCAFINSDIIHILQLDAKMKIAFEIPPTDTFASQFDRACG